MILELVIISTVIILLVYYSIRIVRKKMRKKRFNSFNNEITSIFSEKIKLSEKIEKAKDYCRNTKGEYASGAYIAFDAVQEYIKNDENK